MTTKPPSEPKATVVIGGQMLGKGGLTGILAIGRKQIPFKKSPPLAVLGEMAKIAPQLKDFERTDVTELVALETTLRTLLRQVIIGDDNQALYDENEDALGFIQLADILSDYVHRVTGTPTLPS